MVRNAKTTYHVHQLQNATTKTIWKTIQRHSTHNKPIPALEGQSDCGDKCKALQNALFPPVRMAPRTPSPLTFSPTRETYATTQDQSQYMKHAWLSHT